MLPRLYCPSEKSSKRSTSTSLSILIFGFYNSFFKRDWLLVVCFLDLLSSIGSALMLIESSFKSMSIRFISSSTMCWFTAFLSSSLTESLITPEPNWFRISYSSTYCFYAFIEIGESALAEPIKMSLKLILFSFLSSKQYFCMNSSFNCMTWINSSSVSHSPSF